VPEGLALRVDFPMARIIVMAPAGNREVGEARVRGSSWSYRLTTCPRVCACI